MRKIEDNIITDVRNLFKIKKEIDDNAIKDIRNLFKIFKKYEAIKDTIIGDIRNLFEQKGEDYYKPVRVCNFWSNNYIQYESNGNINKTLSIEEYLNKIRPYLKDIINDLKKSDIWKIQLIIAINFVSSKENDEECVMHSKSNNITIMINDKADEVVEEILQSLLSRYQIELETSIKGSFFL